MLLFPNKDPKKHMKARWKFAKEEMNKILMNNVLHAGKLFGY